MALSVRILLLLAGLRTIAVGPAAAQNADLPARTTRSGVFTRTQAASGGEIYAMSCASCHPAVTHTGPAFQATWQGRSLAELYDFMREAMPKSDPGSLSSREYISVLAYVLQVNGMPPGDTELPADHQALTRIRIEWSKAASLPPNR